MADFSNLLEKNFKAETFGDPREVTIKEVKAIEVGQDKEVKPVAYFVEDRRGLVLNGTKYKQLSEARGTVDADKWVGTRIRIRVNPNVRLGSRLVKGLEIDVLPQA